MGPGSGGKTKVPTPGMGRGPYLPTQLSGASGLFAQQATQGAHQAGDG
jgi:hypothetical protein